MIKMNKANLKLLDSSRNKKKRNTLQIIPKDKLDNSDISDQKSILSQKQLFKDIKREKDKEKKINKSTNTISHIANNINKSITPKKLSKQNYNYNIKFDEKFLVVLGKEQKKKKKNLTH